MSRFHWALCALTLVWTPTNARASISPNHERPDAFRNAINAVIGDESYIARYGTVPDHADPDVRVRTHLEYVYSLLLSRDVSSLPDALRQARQRNLDHLADYIAAGVFPRNHHFADQNRPCFIDHDGRICAVGYLVEMSAGRALAEHINARFQSEFLWRMNLPELDEWITHSGLTLLELAMIQPGYNPAFIGGPTQVGALTVRIRATVYDDGMGCPIKYVTFDFGDGARWVNPVKNKSGFLFVDIQHTYAREGSYTVTGIAEAGDECENLIGYRQWLVNVSAPSLKITAVTLPGGPPFHVYLQTTDEIRLDCLATAWVIWEQDSPAEAAGWYRDGEVYKTAVHTYSWYLNPTISVQNTYASNCVPTQSGRLEIHVPTSATVATEVSTWGRIKSMYR